MRKAFILCVALLIAQVYELNGQVCHRIEPSDRDMHGGHKAMADMIGLAPTANYDLVYHRISVSVDPAVHYIEGNVCSYFRPLPSLSQMAFDLTDTLSVDSIYYHGQSLHTYTHTGNAVTITFANAISDLDSVTVYYSGAPPSTGFGSFNTGFHDSIVPVLWTLSEPYGGRDWFPGKMTLTDKVDSLDFYINMPIGNRAASNGLLMDTLLSGNRLTYHWRTRYPTANYLIAMAVTNYAAYEDTVPTQYGDIHVLNYCYPEDKVDWVAASSNTAAALQLYSNLFGAYPFIKEKYGQAQFNWGGGMEHQTMSFIYATDFELVNHEMAHQWFGDKLTCGSWTDIWLNEGFAVYLSGLCYQNLQPEWWWAFRTTTLGPILRSGKVGSVYCMDTSSSSGIFNGILSYKKGAYLLHMLRWELGDSVFFAALHSYVNDPALTYSFSKTAMLEQHMETQSGRDLSSFFTKWFYGQGYPSYALDWAQHGNALSCKLSQTTTDPSVSFYEMDVPIKFFGSGRDTTLVLSHSYSGQEFAFEVPFTIDSVNIDPELWLISGSNSVRKLPALDNNKFLVLYPNPISDMMTIWYDSQNLNNLSYSIWDMQGKKVMENTVSADGDHYSVSLSGLEGGLYIVKVNTDHGGTSQRIVKY